MTINELFLRCSNIDEWTDFIVFDDYHGYLFDMAPIFAGTFEDMEPELTGSQVMHFTFRGDKVYVEVKN